MVMLRPSRVGLVSDYDLLVLDSISGGRTDNMFPEADSTWKTFNAVEKLLSKTNGKIIGDLMTPAPVVCKATYLEDAARMLLETKYHRLPVVDADGKLVKIILVQSDHVFFLCAIAIIYDTNFLSVNIGIITRGNIVRAALQIKRAAEKRVIPIHSLPM